MTTHRMEPQQSAIALAAIRTATTHYVGLRAASNVKGNAAAARIDPAGDLRTGLSLALSLALEHWPRAHDWEIIGAELVDQAPEGLPPGFVAMRQPIVLGSFTTGDSQK